MDTPESTETEKAILCVRCAALLLAKPDVLARHYRTSHRVILDATAVDLFIELAIRASCLAGVMGKRKAAPKKSAKSKRRSKKREDIMSRGARLPGSFGSGHRT